MATTQNSNAILNPQSSSSSRPLCSICSHQYAIYTCPRCSMRTCSLPCSSKHKSDNSCNGERNKAAYVPMREYGWGAMMDDYTFLEDVGRKVSDWGKEIVKGGFDFSASSEGTRGRSIAGRGRGRGGSMKHHTRTKRDVLKMQLGLRNIDVELLPNGMEKSKKNLSFWDFKKQNAYVTIEYRIHRPRDPTAPSNQPLDPPEKFLIHRNDMSTPLLVLLRGHVSSKGKTKSPFPSWITSLLFPDSDDPDAFEPPVFVMQAPTDPEHASKTQDGPGYYQLDHTKCLLDALRGMTFVEYPVIDVMEKFYGTIVTPSGDRHAQEEPDSQRKRIKLDVKAGKKAINSLLSGYGSDEDDEEEEATTRNAMSTLGQYDDSDDELGSSGHEEEVQGEIDAAAVLELIKSARGEMGLQIDDGEDDVDWGESDVEDEPV